MGLSKEDIGELVEDFAEYLSVMRDPKTVRQKVYNLRHLVDFGSLNLRGFRLAKFYKHLKEKGLKESTIGQILLDTRMFVRWIKRNFPELEVYFDDTTLSEIKKSKKRPRREEREAFTEEELEKILSHLRGREPIFYPFTLVLAYSGLRLSEALSLKKEDLSEEESGFFRIEVKNAKYNKWRIAYLILPPHYGEDFKDFLQKAGDELWTYRYRGGKRFYKLTPDKVVRFYRKLSEELGFKINAHRFRKTFTVYLLRNGVDVATVQRLLGHATARITLEVYAKMGEEVMGENLKRIFNFGKTPKG